MLIRFVVDVPTQGIKEGEEMDVTSVILAPEDHTIITLYQPLDMGAAGNLALDVPRGSFIPSEV